MPIKTKLRCSHISTKIAKIKRSVNSKNWKRCRVMENLRQCCLESNWYNPLEMFLVSSTKIVNIFFLPYNLASSYLGIYSKELCNHIYKSTRIWMLRAVIFILVNISNNLNVLESNEHLNYEIPTMDKYLINSTQQK